MKQLKERWAQYAENGFATFKNLLIRTIILGVLTLGGLYFVNVMVESGATNRYSIVRLFPDFIPMLMAAAKFTFIAMSLCWIRFATRPKPNARHKAYLEVNDTPPASANVVYVCNAVTWVVQMVVFIYLIG